MDSGTVFEDVHNNLLVLFLSKIGIQGILRETKALALPLKYAWPKK